LNKEEKKILCPPAGDNFDNIIPEPGVRIQSLNDSRFKQGNMNFFEKFSKYSSFDFSKTLKETNTKNNQTYLYSKNQDALMISDLVSDSSQNINMKNLSSFASGKDNSSRNDLCLSKMLGNNSLTMSSNLHNMSYTLHKSFSSSKLTVKSPTCLAQTFYDDALSSTNNEELFNEKRKQLLKFGKIFQEMSFKKLNMTKLIDNRRDRSTGVLDKFTKKLVFSSYDDLNIGNKRLLNELKEEGNIKVPTKYNYQKYLNNYQNINNHKNGFYIKKQNKKAHEGNNQNDRSAFTAQAVYTYTRQGGRYLRRFHNEQRIRYRISLPHRRRIGQGIRL
jgi:hypothetical protein